VPVITMMSMGFPRQGGISHDYIQTFLNFVNEIRDATAVIIDIRNAFTGDPLLPSSWLYRFVGEIVPTNFVEVATIPYEQLVYHLESDELYSPDSVFFSLEEYRHLAGVSALDSRHTVSHHTQVNSIIENDTLIILLVDNHTSSTSEHFVDMMFSISNTLVVGQNTFGAAISHRHRSLALPNSGIVFSPGISVRVPAEGYYVEGVGLAPDVWVHGDALTAALALIYGQFNN